MYIHSTAVKKFTANSCESLFHLYFFVLLYNNVAVRGDQIVRIFDQWAIVYYGQILEN
jgi:hypothetical protein